MRRVFLALILGVFLAGCATDRPSTVILVGLDGFRYDYLDRFSPPNLTRLAREGVYAPEGIVSVFPSKTFPNFYSIATGLYPAHHGVVANTMYDGALGAGFRINDRDAVENPAWWGGEPIWITAEKQGVTAANFFWVGSESPHDGLQSTFWKRYDVSIPGEARVDTVLAWLDLPEAERPRMVTLYFSETDHTGHRDGPESAEVEASVAQVDAWIGRLLEGLKARGTYEDVDLVVLADHGMAQLSPERIVVLEDYMDPSLGRITEYSPNLLWDPGAEHVAEIEAALDRMPHVTRLDHATLDSVYRYAGHPRIPPIVALADEGWTIMSTRERAERFGPGTDGGMHGYDPFLPSQRSVFIARGPSFKSGATIPSFTNVDVYPLLARILGLEPADVDGTLEIVGAALRNQN